ncbi:heme ABC exporter ATP-binding protein CcmA [Sphingomonas sp. 10B4]|uniref:heme ABC exporter ATP-binding protein CcmA n=1 Tax=Sphingomonas sp. 10B4 TaxID=3048575 RepID=UPI002AB35D4F|nr:heme ABC exporter ATP-binding protein CcmA [Sphingomonas sp. 10B4]MDY7524435.1 heme ABC exporter ATP-binding protein CcmA [Sphingomonas sp. 10B4]MEB0283038.1 heme ABC exporter ATP-binding protein CcmA [Sphingomonas sp. 10B4]
MTPLFAFRDVACVRGGRMLFEHVSFAVAPGGAVLVSGPNGVGKSSLIRIAAGLLRPADGEVTVPPQRALMAEAAALDPARPLGAALHFWATLDPAPASATERVAKALEAVGLAAIAAVPVRLLSTGQRRRAALARVVASGAPLWLLDEPANGLDVASVGLLEALIATHRAAGGAVAVATHLPIALPDAMPVVLG